ncbi:MAG: tRNA dihydrouridine synthase DusB [Candidatus Omnitrophica bacterium]|nr:tRNA dihydrouridine synthase DusB [Candidatus Omnitrophota bacterium]
MLQIGSLKLKSNLILAPMAGISDLPFRLLNRKFGAELAFVEMINARSIGHKSKKTVKMLASTAQDKPLGVQLLGCEPQYILRALDVLKKFTFDVLDFNAACPAKKVTRRGEGASLLRDTDKLKSLLRIVVRNSDVPVTIKIRIGWDKDSINAKEVALLAEDAGVKAIFVHGRTKLQGYSGNVDYGSIKKVKSVVKIPVIASGDVLSAELVKKMFDETGCDGVAVARGSLGNPWIFQEAKEYLKKGVVVLKPTAQEIAEIMLEHLNSSVDFYGENVGVVKFRKFFGWYTKGLRQVRVLRERSSQAKTMYEMSQIIHSSVRPEKQKTPLISSRGFL